MCHKLGTSIARHCTLRTDSSGPSTSTASLALTLYPGEGVVVEIGSTPLGGLMPNPYSEVEVWDYNDIDGPALGVTTNDCTDLDYCWIQTHGPCPVLCDIAFILGNHIRMSDAVDGSCEPLNRDGSAEDDLNIGTALLIAPAQADYGMAFLTFGP